MAPAFLIIGNPENRRVRGFQEALAQAGLAQARVVSWLELARGARALEDVPDGPMLVRIDAFGETSR